MSKNPAECTCFLLEPRYHTTHYGATDPATIAEPDPDCPVHFPQKQKLTTYEKLERARRKVAKWNRLAEREVVGPEYQAATIKLRKWQKKEDYWFERWAEE